MKRDSPVVPEMRERYFTLEQADALVPELAQRMKLVLQLHVHLRTMCRALLREGVRVTPESLASGEQPDVAGHARMRVQHARGLYETVREAIAGIEALGAVVKDVEQGLVDFPSWLDGAREVQLCWRVGETRIEWYHDLDAGFGGRKSTAGRSFCAARS
ncbi:MAG: DUF2203 domain-containing protein [Deltaproteobacteria bacterium]|nr:DUF2203 domain-containing protein [Nannocystaceae bacterium]